MSSEDRRRLILDAAARLFRHYGQGKMTIADIARAADVGVGTVYLEFSSKEQIIEELSSGAHVRVLDAMRRVAHARALESFSERLAGVVEARITTFLQLNDEGLHACELVHCTGGAVRSVHEQFRQEERAFLREMFEQARHAHELADDVDPKRAAALIQLAYTSFSPPWLFQQPVDEARRAAYDMCRLLLLGLMPRRDPLDPDRPLEPPARRRRRPR
jgi:AcrR family transcriptional regulator